MRYSSARVGITTLTISICLLALGCAHSRSEKVRETSAQVKAAVSNDGWYIRICKSETEAADVKFKCGRDKNDRDPWFEWHNDGKGGSETFALPGHLNKNEKVWIELESFVKGKDIVACVFYAENYVKLIKTNDAEDHELKTSDREGRACPCGK